jgi:hypothetical protein
MLVECPNCDISFNPETGVCPRCRRFRPNLTECDDFIRSRVRSDIESGFVKVDDLIRRLQEKGMASGKAVEIVEEARRRYQQGVRQRATQRIVLGTLLLVVGPIFLFIGAFHLGAISFVVGVAFLGFGVVRLARGHD